MDALIVVRRLTVENANCVAGMTWGFPSISGFLGFVHNLSRKLKDEFAITLDGCGIVVHRNIPQVFKRHEWAPAQFCLSRNPLTKSGGSPSFNEEGRTHLTVSLLIPCLGDVGGPEKQAVFTASLKGKILSQKLAGGNITGLAAVEFVEQLDTNSTRRLMRKLLPGFSLVQRSRPLVDALRDESKDSLDSWLNFFTLKQHAVPTSTDNLNGKADWRYVEKPVKGWIVPLMVGYRRVSELFNPGSIPAARDATVQFSFVEGVYSIGEWISPHRVTEVSRLVWRYNFRPDSDLYFCINNYEMGDYEQEVR